MSRDYIDPADVPEDVALHIRLIAEAIERVAEASERTAEVLAEIAKKMDQALDDEARR